MNKQEQTDEELMKIIFKLFNAYSYGIKIDIASNYYTSRFLLVKENRIIKINISKRNMFLKLKENECLDLEKNPKKVYYINYDDLEFLSRSNRLNSLLNDL